MMNVNKVLLSGTIASDIEIKNNDDRAVIYFILSTEFDYKENGQYRTGYDIFEVFTHGAKLARNPELKKGAGIFIEGQLTRYANGKLKYSKNVVWATKIYFL